MESLMNTIIRYVYFKFRLRLIYVPCLGLGYCDKAFGGILLKLLKSTVIQITCSITSWLLQNLFIYLGGHCREWNGHAN